MSDVVFILGAGASKDCGAPLMANFLDVASDLLWKDEVKAKRDQFKMVFEVIGKLQAVHSKAQLDLNNIESIFTIMELGKVIQALPGQTREGIPTAIAALKDLIVTTIEATMAFPVISGRPAVPQPYDRFAKLLKYLQAETSPTRSVSVITFNYDIAADMAMTYEGLGPDYVVESLDKAGRPVQLMKLHGSLNWATEKNDQGRIRPLHLSKYLSFFSCPGSSGSIKVPISTQLVEYFKFHESIDVEREPVIVPPSWNKADYHEALTDVWAAAARHLSETKYIFVIGYSLPVTDSFFRHLYALGSVGESPLKKFVVFNPDKSGATDRRFQELLGPGAVARYDYQEEDFANAIEHIRSFFPKGK